MTQLDPRTSTEAPALPLEPGQPGPSSEPPFNWHVSLIMFIGLVVLFGTLFGLRALHIWPPDPGQDPEIVAAYATRAALQTQAAVATPLPATVVAAAPAAPIIGATPAEPSTVSQPANATPGPFVIGPLAPAPVTAPATSAPIAVATPEPATKPQIGPTEFQTSAPAATPVAPPAAAAPQALTATSVPTTQPEAQPTPVAIALPADLAQAILQGYSNYWAIRIQAMRDPSDTNVDLESAMGGTELAIAQKTIADYRGRGEAYSTKVSHQVWITNATPTEATIVDLYTATSQVLDPATSEPSDASQAVVEHRRDAFLLGLSAGVWKVVDEPPED